MSRALRVLPFVSLTLWAFVACGPELSPVSKIDTLRILALRKSAPYATPGEVVDLELLWEGAKPDEVERFFGFWCVNPPGNLYGQCLTNVPTVPPSVAFNQDKFSIQIPEDIIREPAPGSGEAAYGTAFVFYAVCRGHLTFNGRPIDPDAGQGGLAGSGQGGVAGSSSGGTPAGTGGNGPGPIVGLPDCVDDEGEPVGSAGLVIGYSQIFAYDGYKNENPIIDGFEINGTKVAVDCLNSECIGKPYEPSDARGCTPDLPCFSTCASTINTDCEANHLRPLVDRASAERDLVALDTFGTDIGESLWVSYFTDQGSFNGELRLINDATTGWIEDYKTDYYAPKEPGPVALWAVVRDNRGGVSFARVRGYAEASDE